MVERIYHRDKDTEENQIPEVDKCSHCGGKLDKGVEIVIVGAIKGYKGTYCSYECSRLGGGEVC